MLAFWTASDKSRKTQRRKHNFIFLFLKKKAKAKEE
jgi:hypothetical protein